MPEQYTRKPNTTCTICNKPLYRRPVIIRMNHGRAFCSKTCFGIFCRKESPCIVCGKLILAGLHKKTCGRVCANKNRAGIRYKAGRPRDRATLGRTLKERLAKLRGEACERCAYSTYQVLQVHHRDRDRHNNDLKNLELLCPNCHFEEHILVR